MTCSDCCFIIIPWTWMYSSFNFLSYNVFDRTLLRWLEERHNRSWHWKRNIVLFHRYFIIPIIIYVLYFFYYTKVTSNIENNMNQNYKFSNFSCKFELRSGAGSRILAVLCLVGQNEVLETNFLEVWGKLRFNPCLSFAG